MLAVRHITKSALFTANPIHILIWRWTLFWYGEVTFCPPQCLGPAHGFSCLVVGSLSWLTLTLPPNYTLTTRVQDNMFTTLYLIIFAATVQIKPINSRKLQEEFPGIQLQIPDGFLMKLGCLFGCDPENNYKKKSEDAISLNFRESVHFAELKFIPIL